ncbi:beta/gamma crystallin-related protein [Sphingomonas sp. 1P06PA]|uniref:beta/gamma crystallin-related protein n=1 Tax=Sphingomonas sp. 1P06PA TaxID=554121 RepID=UPI0039A50C3C
MRSALFIAAALAPMAPGQAQSPSASITFYELPAYIGRSVTLTTDSPDLATQGFAKRAQSARVVGEWQVCPQSGFAGGCQTLNADQPLLRKSTVASARRSGASAQTASSSSTSNSSTAAASTGTAVDLDTLDASSGTEGQDVAFFATPTLSGTAVSAGSNDVAAGTAFCKVAGYATAAYAGRARSQSSNIIDIAAKVKTRGFALKDVLCRR